MRAGWENKSLKDICSVYGRIGFRGYTKADFVSSPDDGAITLSPSNIISGELRCDKCSYVSWEKYYQSPEIMIFPGDILLVKTASIGKCALVRSLPHEATINPQFVVLKEIKANHQYLTYFLQSPTAQKKFQEFAIGAAVPTFSQKKLEGLIVPVPSLPEQQRIVAILDQEFAKIDALKANAEKSLQAAKDLFQATLKKELEPKDGWKTQTIGDVCFVQGGSTPRRTEKAFWENGTYPWFTVDDIREQGRIITDTKQKITKLAWEKMRVFPANSVLLCCTASVGEYALSTIPITSNQQFNGLTIKDERTILPMFLFHFASTLKDTLLSLSGKTTIDFVSGGKVRSVPISFPVSVKEQESIISRLDDLNEKCDTLQDNYQKTLALCDDLKQSLLRKAFNGEL